MRHTPSDIVALKDKQPIVCLTAYSAPFAHMLDPHVDILLVGDSLGMVLYGMESTRGVSVDMMIAHGKAVSNQATNACVVVDMPYGSYQESLDEALENAQRILKETGCDAVKLEGGVDMAQTIKHLTSHNIPVMGHIGLMPQYAPDMGGFKVQGRDEASREALLNDVQAVEAAGVFSFVIEGVSEKVADELTQLATTPTIGIGASKACDGQVLVSEDMLGIALGKSPKFVKHYASLHEDIEQAAQQFAADVRSGTFPTNAQLYK